MTRTYTPPVRAIITGASSGIGAALARELARRGWMLALLARRADLIESLTRELPQTSVALACDVTDANSVREAVRRGEEVLGGPFDLAVANAGVGLPSPAAKFNLVEAELMMRVNIFGMFNLFDAVIPSMVERRSGRFAGVASLAGLRGLPATSVYSATKAAMQAFLEASRIDLLPYSVGVTTINPGFVETAMTERNRFKMPFLMKVEAAARIMADGLERGRRVIEFPWAMSVVMRFSRLLPASLWERVTAPYAWRAKASPK